jgi:serine/threonine-protein kinase
MGTVYLAEDKHNNNKNCVIKQLNNKHADEAERKEAIRLFEREADILRDLNHPGIVRFFDSYAEVESGRYYLVMDYVPGKNLEAIINANGPLSSELTVRIAIQCCDVLEYLHTRNPPVIYRDVKPSNLMLRPDGLIVFIDFGIARSFMPRDVATRVVTAGYSAPEQYFGKPETRSDLYSLGATMAHLVTGTRPKPLSTCNPALANPAVLPSLNRLIMRLTAHDVEDRPPSTQATRYTLYKIYKELHPEFQIPEMPESAWDDTENARTSMKRNYGVGTPEEKPAAERGPGRDVGIIISSAQRILSGPPPTSESAERPLDVGIKSGRRMLEPERLGIMAKLKRFISQLR